MKTDSGNLAAEDVSEILFDLVSADRLSLLSQLNSQKQKLTSLSKLLGCTVQECARNLNRLTNSSFIKKDSEGFYEITPFGSAMLSMIPSFQFLVREREYFLSHELSFLPQSILRRIGDVSDTTRIDHMSKVLNALRDVISSGKEFVWLMTDQIIVVGSGIGKAFGSKDIPVRGISEESINLETISEIRAVLPHSENGVLREVKMSLAINENQAVACFPSLNGKIDFNAGFLGNDRSFRSWCSDLFEYYWSKSRKIHSPIQLKKIDEV